MLSSTRKAQTNALCRPDTPLFSVTAYSVTNAEAKFNLPKVRTSFIAPGEDCLWRAYAGTAKPVTFASGKYTIEV